MFRSPLIDGLVVIVVLLLLVGPKKLPQLGRGLGDGMREFKEGITGENKGEREVKEQPLSLKPVDPAASSVPTVPTQQTAAPSREAGSEPRQ